MKEKSQTTILLDTWRSYIEMSADGILKERYSMKDIDWDLQQYENKLNDREKRLIKLEIYRRIADLRANR